MILDADQFKLLNVAHTRPYEQSKLVRTCFVIEIRLLQTRA